MIAMQRSSSQSWRMCFSTYASLPPWHRVEEAPWHELDALDHAALREQLARGVEHARVVAERRAEMRVTDEDLAEQRATAAADVAEPLDLRERIRRGDPRGVSERHRHHAVGERLSLVRMLVEPVPDALAVHALEGVLAGAERLREIAPRLHVGARAEVLREGAYVVDLARTQGRGEAVVRVAALRISLEEAHRDRAAHGTQHRAGIGIGLRGELGCRERPRLDEIRHLQARELGDDVRASRRRHAVEDHELRRNDRIRGAEERLAEREEPPHRTSRWSRERLLGDGCAERREPSAHASHPVGYHDARHSALASAFFLSPPSRRSAGFSFFLA